MGTLYPTHKPGLSLHYGKYTNGIPEAGVPASVVDADHLNLLTDNIEEAIKAAGLDPSHATTDVDQLKKALLWAAGIWQAGTDYPEGATVLQGGSRYIATRAHTASGTNAPGQSGAPWASLATETSIAAAIALAKAEGIALAAAGIWQAGANYPEGATVLQGSTRYIATQTHTASSTNAPGQSGAPWASLATETSIAAAIALARAEAIALAAAGIWQAGTDYPEGATVLQGGTRYIATQTHTASSTNAPVQSGAPWESVDYRSFNKLWPVGSVYTNYSSALNPADSSLLGFGTWHPLPANYFLAQAGGEYAADQKYGDALPNIEGTLTTPPSYEHIGGAFSPRWEGYQGQSGGGLYVYRVNFSARESNRIYGEENYVRPKTIGAYMWKRLA
ncbi:hypothetical protein P0082_07680 [Candidatus Haliotispira prima]|uniref:Chitin-binding type-3 domain-containing protein n=1 Tax=Candidatus Haliotispira prima TaxID=3034016 RepID=A0ABY8MED9_9SPIO|nr:hypothetical protein P0082_07680 [Candidatus Haliotispira prima]